MIALGVLLVILGVGSLALPYLGLQSTLIDSIDAYQPWVGIIVAAVGLITVLFGAQRRGRDAVRVEAPPAAAPPERTYPTDPPERSDET